VSPITRSDCVFFLPISELDANDGAGARQNFREFLVFCGDHFTSAMSPHKVAILAAAKTD
jgi:hypothetical protein